MAKNPKQQSVTMRGGKNVAPGAPAPKKTPKADTTEPEEKNLPPDPEPEKSDQ